MKKFQSKIIKTIERYNMLDRCDHVIVAVSGGPDSVALTSVLLELRKEFDLKLTLAHLHHGVRPKEADEDLEFVKGLAEKWHVPLEVGRARLGIRLKKMGNLEEVMRERRYAFLERARNKHGADLIALGHNANDVAETLLINLLRGSGVSGLSGIPPAQGKLIRPLIHCEREEILDFLKKKKLKYRIDSSNADLRFLRNRIRHELMPRLAQYNPSIVGTLLRTAQSFHELDGFLSGLAGDSLGTIAKIRKDRVEISIPKFKNLPHALRIMVLREAIREQKGDLRRISQRHLVSVDSIATGPRPNAVLSLPGKLRAERVYDKLLLSDKPGAKAAKTSSARLKIPGGIRIDFPGLGRATLSVSTLSKSQRRATTSGKVKKSTSLKRIIEDNIAFLDRDILPGNLLLRPFRPGDRIQPLGMRGRRKLKDIFMEMKVPREMRKGFPVLASGDEVVWVPGYRIAEPYKIKPSTRSSLKISIKFSTSKKTR